MIPIEVQARDLPSWWQEAQGGLSTRLRDLVPTVCNWAAQQERIYLLQAVLEPPKPSAAAPIRSYSPELERQKRQQSKRQLDELIAAVRRSFDKQTARDVLKVIGRVIETLNRTRESPLPLPPIPRRVRVQRDPFEEDVVGALKTVRQLRYVESEWIKKRLRGPVPLELVVLSAILHGDLLHRSMVDALLERMSEEQCPLDWWGEIAPYRLRPTKLKNAMPFVNLSLNWGTTKDAELRRWFPDLQTTCLIVHADYSSTGRSSEGGRRDTDTIWVSLRRRILELGMTKRDVPNSLGQLMATVRLARRSDDYPSFLVGLCSRTIVAHAVRPSVLRRLAGLPAVSSETEVIEQTQEPQLPQATLRRRRDTEYESVWYDHLRKALKGSSPKSVAANVEALLVPGDTYPEYARRIMEFASFIVANGSAAGNTLKLSSVRTYTSLVARHLGGMLEGQDPTALAVTDLISIYGQVLDAAEQGRNARGMRRQVGRALREFHRYLVQVYRMEGVNPAAVFGIGRDLIPVDANLLTVDEYFQVLEAIRRLARSPEEAQIAILLTILGFRLGLRRMEGHGLRLRDVAENGIPMLLIRNWAGRHLKTKGSARLVPLTLMPNPELRLLLAWKQKRVEQDGAKPDDYLFAVPTSARDVINVNVFVLIHRAMRMVTNDPTMRYHHLRHSAANFIALQLCLSDFESIPDLFPKLPLTTDMLRRSAEFRRTFYAAFPACKWSRSQNQGEKYSDGGPTGQHLFGVAQLLGHADPGTTLENYLHLLDLLVPLYRERSDFFPEQRKNAILASRMPESTAYRHGDALAAAAWVEVHAERQPAAKEALEARTATPVPQRWIERLWRMLHDGDTYCYSSEELAVEYGFESPEEVDELRARGRALRDTCHPIRPEPLWTMASWIPDQRYPEKELRLACPWYSNHAVDRAAISRLEHELAYVLADPDSAPLAERGLDLFVSKRTDVIRSHPEILVGHQTGRGPLVFSDVDEAKCFVQFLVKCGLKRKRTIDNNVVLQESEFGFLLYGQGPVARAWEEQLRINWRDNVDRTHMIGHPELLGIVVPMQTELGRKLKGSLGFRFIMMMAWIAIPLLKKARLRHSRE